LFIILVLVWERFQEKLLFRIIVTWQVIYPEETTVRGSFLPLSDKMLSVLSFLKSNMIEQTQREWLKEKRNAK
jgi:hypothetical protein